MKSSARKALTILVGALGGSVVGSMLTAVFFTGLGNISAQELPKEPETKEISAGSFRLVDNNGRTRGLFGMGESGEPSLALYDTSGFAMVTVGILDNRAGIAIFGNEQEKKRASLLVGIDGSTPQVGLTSRSGGAVVVLSIDDGKLPKLQLVKTGRRGSSVFSTFAALQVLEEGSLLLLAPVHEVQVGEENEPPPNAVLAGRIDFDGESYGVKLKGKDKDSDWPPVK